MGYEIKFLFRTDDSVNVKVKDAIVKALTEAGFKATPVPTTTANYWPPATTPAKTSTSAPRAGAPTGRRAPPGSRRSSARPTRTQSHSFGSNYSAFSNKGVDTQMDAIQRMPIGQQAAAWNNLDKQIAQKYFPLFTTYYGGIAQAHGSKIQGDNDDNTLGMPTWKDMWISQ